MNKLKEYQALLEISIKPSQGVSVTKKANKIQKILHDKADFTLQNKSICFLPGNRLPKNTAGDGLLATVQELIKRNGRLYYMLLIFFAPVITSVKYKIRLKSLLNKYGEDAIVLNLGSGPQSIKKRNDIINIDIYAFDEVDIVADGTDLPINSNSVDLIICTAMLEHIAAPEKVVSEMYRILKKNGEIICVLPFMSPGHAAPHDFSRWTFSGIKQLFHSFEKPEIGISAGPTSALLWTFQEWLAIFFSFGSRAIHDLLFLFLMIVTSPIKILDIFLEHFPGAEKVACAFYVVSKK